MSGAPRGERDGERRQLRAGDQRRREPDRVLEHPRRTWSGASTSTAAIRDVFVRDMAAATTSLVSRTAGSERDLGQQPSERASIDASGTRIAFETFASDLVPGGDVNGSSRRRARCATRPRSTTELVSRAPGLAGAQAGESSGTASISGNGDCVAFETFADEFVADAAGHRPPAGGGTGRCAATARSARCPARRRRRPAAGPARDSARHDRPGPLRRQHRAAPLPARQARQAAHPQAAADRGADPLHAVGGGDGDDPDRRAAPGAAAGEALRPRRGARRAGVHAGARSGAARSPAPGSRARTASRSPAACAAGACRPAPTGPRSGRGTRPATPPRGAGSASPCCASRDWRNSPPVAARGPRRDSPIPPRAARRGPSRCGRRRRTVSPCRRSAPRTASPDRRPRAPAARRRWSRPRPSVRRRRG